MKPFALLFLICAITFSAQASDIDMDNILDYPEVNRLTRQLAEAKRQDLIDRLVDRDNSSMNLCCQLPSDYSYNINKLLPDHGPMADRRDCIDTCNVKLAKNKCTYSTTCGCIAWCSAVTMLAGLGMTTTGLCSLCVNCAEIAPTCDLSTGICCKLAYIGGSISCASLFIGCVGLAGCIPKYGWMQSWERSRLNYSNHTLGIP